MIYGQVVIYLSGVHKFVFCCFSVSIFFYRRYVYDGAPKKIGSNSVSKNSETYRFCEYRMFFLICPTPCYDISVADIAAGKTYKISA